MTTAEDATPEPPGPVGLRAEFRDAITVRAAVLVAGVALLQLGFVASYIGMFHQPTPHRLALAVEAPADISAKVVSQLNAVTGSPLEALAVPTVAAGKTRLLHREAYGVLVVDPHAQHRRPHRGQRLGGVGSYGDDRGHATGGGPSAPYGPCRGHPSATTR